MALINRPYAWAWASAGESSPPFLFMFCTQVEHVCYSTVNLEENSLRALTDVLLQATLSAFIYGFYYVCYESIFEQIILLVYKRTHFFKRTFTKIRLGSVNMWNFELKMLGYFRWFQKITLPRLSSSSFISV